MRKDTELNCEKIFAQADAYYSNWIEETKRRKKSNSLSFHDYGTGVRNAKRRMFDKAEPDLSNKSLPDLILDLQKSYKKRSRFIQLKNALHRHSFENFLLATILIQNEVALSQTFEGDNEEDKIKRFLESDGKYKTSQLKVLVEARHKLKRDTPSMGEDASRITVAELSEESDSNDEQTSPNSPLLPASQVDAAASPEEQSTPAPRATNPIQQIASPIKPEVVTPEEESKPPKQDPGDQQRLAELHELRFNAQKSLDQQKDLRNKHQAELTQVQTQLDIKTEKLEQLNEEITELSQTQEQNLEAIQQDIEQLTQHQAEVEKTIKQDSEALDKLTDQKAELERECAQQAENLKQLEQQLAECDQKSLEAFQHQLTPPTGASLTEEEQVFYTQCLDKLLDQQKSGFRTKGSQLREQLKKSDNPDFLKQLRVNKPNNFNPDIYDSTNVLCFFIVQLGDHKTMGDEYGNSCIAMLKQSGARDITNSTSSNEMKDIIRTHYTQNLTHFITAIYVWVVTAVIQKVLPQNEPRLAELKVSLHTRLLQTAKEKAVQSAQARISNQKDQYQATKDKLTELDSNIADQTQKLEAHRREKINIVEKLKAKNQAQTELQNDDRIEKKRSKVDALREKIISSETNIKEKQETITKINEAINKATTTINGYSEEIKKLSQKGIVPIITPVDGGLASNSKRIMPPLPPVPTSSTSSTAPPPAPPAPEMAPPPPPPPSTPSVTAGQGLYNARANLMADIRNGTKLTSASERKPRAEPEPKPNLVGELFTAVTKRRSAVEDCETRSNHEEEQDWGSDEESTHQPPATLRPGSK